VACYGYPPATLGNTVEDTYVPGLEINKDRDLWLGQEEDAVNGRHPHKTVNVGYVDGHSDRTRADDLLVEKPPMPIRTEAPFGHPGEIA